MLHLFASPRPASATTARPSTAVRALPWLLLVAILTALVLSRSAETMGEVDRYGEAAERLLAGQLVPDPFHPYGCRLAIAAIMTVTGLSSLHAGAILAALGALAFAFGAAALAERLRPGSGSITAWLVATNAIVWTQGSTVSADMPAAGLFLLGVGITASTTHWTIVRSLGIGVALGLAVAMHTSLLPIIVPVLLLAAWRARKLRAIAGLAAGSAIGYLPQLVPALMLGTGVIGESWQGLYLKARLDFDSSRLLAEQQAGTLPGTFEFLLTEWQTILTDGISDLGKALDVTLPAMMLGTNPKPTLVLWWLPLSALVTLLVVARDRRFAGLVIAFVGAQLGLVCFTFHPLSRVLLPSLGVMLVATGITIDAVARNARWRPVPVMLVCGLLLLLGVPTARQFVDSQPVAEIAAARRVPTQFDGPVAALSTYSLLDRYVAYPTFRIQRPTPEAYRDAETAWQTLRTRLEQSGANVLLVGRRSDLRAFSALRTATAPAGFRWLHRDNDVLVAELLQATSNWIAALEVNPRPATIGRPCTFTVRLSDSAEDNKIASVGLALRAPDGSQQLLDLPLATNHRFARQAALPIVGEWRLAPIILQRDGTLLRGAERRITVNE